jgi:hypothetical protein
MWTISRAHYDLLRRLVALGVHFHQLRHCPKKKKIGCGGKKLFVYSLFLTFSYSLERAASMWVGY